MLLLATLIGALLSTIVGVDKQRQGHQYILGHA